MPNIAVVVLDTLRYDNFIDHFAWLDGRQFTKAYSTSHWTVPAHASLLTGVYPSEAGTKTNARTLNFSGSTLPELLQGEGYTTRMVASNQQLHAWDGWERGFDQRIGPRNRDIEPVPDGAFDWMKYVGSTDTTGLWTYLHGMGECLQSGYSIASSLRFGCRLKFHEFRSSPSIRNRIKATDFGDKEFLLINIMDTHQPYYPPKQYRSIDRKFSPSLEDSLIEEIDNPAATRRAYDESAAYLSQIYRDIFYNLQQDFNYIVTIADHGEYLGERGLWTHSYGLGQELTHIPLVISGKGVESESINEVVSILDLYETIVTLAGIDAESRGQSLIGEIQETDRLIEFHGLAEPRRKLFKEHGIGNRFDAMSHPLNAIISAEGYAEEMHKGGLRVSGVWDEDEARNRLDNLIIDRDPAEDLGEEGDMSQTVQARLEYLGYV